MKSLLAITLICLAALAPEAAVAAKATSKGTYIVPTSHPRMISWYDLNRHNVYKAANAEIIKSYGKNEYLVRSITPVGQSTYVVRETRIDKDDSTVYRITLINRVSGRIANNRTVVTVQDRGAESQVTMTVYIDFQHRFAPSWAVKRVTDRSVSQTKNLMLRNAR